MSVRGAFAQFVNLESKHYMNNNIKPLPGLVLLEQVGDGFETMSPSGIILKHNVPPGAQTAKVIAAGPDKTTGGVASVKEGDVVIYDVHRVIQCTLPDSRQMMVNETDILGVLEDEAL